MKIVSASSVVTGALGKCPCREGYAEVLRQSNAVLGPKDAASALIDPRRPHLKDRGTRDGAFQQP